MSVEPMPLYTLYRVNMTGYRNKLTKYTPVFIVFESKKTDMIYLFRNKPN